MKIAWTVLFSIALLGSVGSLLAAHSATVPSGLALQPPTMEHWLGTDDLGIDLWAQLCQGARLSLGVGAATALLAGGIGALAGIAAGYCGGWLDRFLMRLTDLVLALPELPMMILLGAFFGPSVLHIIFVLVLFSWTGTARIVRSRVFSLKQEAYVQMADAYGGGFFYMVRRHFWPPLFPLVMVSVIRLTGKAIIAEAGLAFLGLGDPLAKSWGLILNHALHFKGIYFTSFWQWWLAAPLAAMTLLVSAVAMLGRNFEERFKR